MKNLLILAIFVGFMACKSDDQNTAFTGGQTPLMASGECFFQISKMRKKFVVNTYEQEFSSVSIDNCYGEALRIMDEEYAMLLPFAKKRVRFKLELFHSALKNPIVEIYPDKGFH